jgi:transcriptional regulator with XRE-family HTH domain
MPPAPATDLLGTVVDQIVERMREKGVSRSELARSLGVSAAYVTKVLNRRANFTLESLGRLADALDARLTVSLEPRPPAPTPGARTPPPGTPRRPSEVPGGDESWRCW